MNDVPVAGRIPLINNTICYNKAPDGAGIYSYNVDWLLMNSIVWHDTGGSDIYPEGGSFFVVYSNTEDGWNDTGSVCLPPGFVDTLYRLPDTSHCIGAGTNSFQLDGIWYYAPPRCIDGSPRPNPAPSRSDIGACESPLGGPTGVAAGNNTIPTSFVLEQNYPNPFNPTTTISYQLPTQVHITLKVFDVLGCEVATLVDEGKQPGTCSVQWNASGIASGVYFYRLDAGSFTSVKKLLLLR